MKKTRAVIERFLLSPAHPFLLSIYFVLRMYADNAADIPMSNLFRPLLISVLVSAVFFWLFLRFVRSSHTVGFMTSALVIAFYVYKLIASILPFGKYLPVRAFTPLWAMATVLLVIFLGWRIRMKPSREMIAGLNLMSCILLLFPIIQLAVIAISWSLFPAPKVNHVFQGTLPASPPDIYYIILDSYPRADVLRDEYDYDNGPFLQSIKNLGFYVAECSQSNYSSTALSLTSSLNLDYLQNLSDTFRPNTAELLGLYKYLDHNAVRESLSNMGYKTIAFASGFPWAEWRDADFFIAPPDGPMTEFETLLLQSTYASVLDNTSFIDYEEKYAERFRVRTRLVLGSFEQLANTPGPKLVFIHLLVPHPPLAFDEFGNPVPAVLGNSKKGYLAQVKFINTFLVPRLKILIETSHTPPVIILQGDHGPLLEGDYAAEMKILNAYYLPKGSELLYPAITPVNSFRVVFNSYFGTSFPLLEDVSYFSDRHKRYDFSIVPALCPS